jgi:YbgC/YbaW family acyl-CoA thioester hydrolase
MKHTENFTVKWHDTDAYRCVRPSEVLVYMQECANLHLEHFGLSLDALRDEKKLAFILSKIKIIFHKRLHAYDKISVRTWTCESRGYTFVRCFDIHRGDELVAEAISFWALLDLDNRRLVRNEDFSLGIENDPVLDIAVPRRIRPASAEFSVLGKRDIRYSDIDYNMHMNNTKYPDMLCDFMPIEQVANISEMTLEFLRESALGDTLEFSCAAENNDFYFKTANSSKDACLSAKITVE